MRAEIQEILDKDWPDTTSGRFVTHGAKNMQRALIRMAMHAQDTGDEDLHEQAVNAASNIRHPDFLVDEPATMLRVVIPQYHNVMHDTKQKILIFKEKHGNWRFVTNNATEFSLALLTIMEQRVDEEWYLDELYGDDLPAEDIDPDQTDMFKKTEAPKTDMQKAKDIIERARSGEPGCVIKAGKAALEFFQSHEDYEYEGFEIDYPNKATFDLTNKIGVL